MEREARRAFLRATFVGCLTAFVLDAAGCALFEKGKKSKDEEFTDDEEYGDDAFSAERKNQESASDFVAKTGRGGKEKREISRGETFLMSSKAREIYANTER
ncbi:MAG: hypothetical protein HUK22_00550 [Thermoguttaceae bacterium]|nr:hypothetical protein [Thermoguttaceae bacterium]